MENKSKVLCVDDESINLFILKRVLGKKYEVITADHGEEALAILEKDPEIKLIVSDMKMPIMDGLEFIRKAHQLFTEKKYFLLSGFTITDEIQKALDSKLICEYFEKPADFEEMNRALEEHA